MANPTPERSARRPLDAVALARVTRRLQRAATPPWLHVEVARRMAERLPVIRLQPQCIGDWGAFLGASGAVLAQAYPGASILRVEPVAGCGAAPMPSPAKPWWSPRRWAGMAARSAPVAAFDPGSVQLLWANMQLHGAIDPQAVMSSWCRALAVDGFLMFSTLGPGSLHGLRDLYARAGWPPPMAPLVDMHDLGDMLVEAGFADPVMDQETLTLTWPTPEALLAELRGLGGNVARERVAGLRTPRWRAQLLARLAALADAAGRIPMVVELVYGHAFKPAPRPRLAEQTALPLDDFRSMVKASRRRV